MAAAPLIPAYDFVTPPATGLSIESISHLSWVFLSITSENYTQSLEFIPQNFNRFQFLVDVSTLKSDDVTQIKQLLNVGASKVITSLKQLESLRDPKLQIDEDRLILAIPRGDNYTRDEFESAIRHTSLGVFVPDVPDVNVGSVIEWLEAYGTENRPPVYISFKSEPVLEEVLKLVKLNATTIINSQQLTVDSKNESGLLSVAPIFATALKSDRPDKLFTTLVVDEQGVALGLVYSSPESISESLRTGSGVYQSRQRGLWYKGATSGAVQELVRINMDCDADCLRFTVKQKGKGFCHLDTRTCFGSSTGLGALEATLQSRFKSAPEGSYTARLFNDPALLKAKIMEEAEELCDAKTKEDVAWEAADLIYFALTKCVSAGVSIADIEKNLDAKSLKVVRRKGDAKEKWTKGTNGANATKPQEPAAAPAKAVEIPAQKDASGDRIEMRRYFSSEITAEELEAILKRPSQKSSETIMGIVNPIIKAVREDGDKALLGYTQKFDRCPDLKSTVLRAPYPESLMTLTTEVKAAIDLSYENILKFHSAQKESKPLVVETMPGVQCSRFARPIERVGLYIPGGTAVLPSTALMLGVPALVAGCKTIVFASPPRPDGSITPEIVYIAHKVGAEAIVLAGGAQAVAALAYGTESVPKVDKILGPGNQFVTAAKMVVSNDTGATVSIDMPAGPSEVLVIADKSANPAFVASDLLSQAEHGVDSQVVLLAVDLSNEELQAIDDELHKQAMALPRVDIVRGAIAHSVTVVVDTIDKAFEVSNLYAPEHLILQIANANACVEKVQNAGSVFIGQWTPESVGDYSAGVNHSLPTYGYAKQYSGVNLATYVKHITSSELTADGLQNLGTAVMDLAAVEGLDAHRMAVKIRLDHMAKGTSI
ncbi:trifunctional histidinol dehydrogenase [Orbilia oligospora]|uniref:Histidine biosynthesis trifunctional protein n=1 Tax=Orbilia oligospora TaxID=2813651 RepID=A0A6G1LVT2_ORBOL|nr:trifunctional histidinol dehydrogenase [Orbilia oligospora]KAF3226354.1 trifunctional histidinol dehydrogenase [Orbilia oligospora]KAF3228912.1 trifunctional histidinol dehydrogenase [Orbilia oligospora]KAF3235950.1 trifunctional histidinol dehydrogenase [Orbilia oligospora]